MTCTLSGTARDSWLGSLVGRWHDDLDARGCQILQSCLGGALPSHRDRTSFVLPSQVVITQTYQRADRVRVLPFERFPRNILAR